MAEVSIVIPAYNRVDLLEQTIQSCLAQTFTDCEILVIDDGSETPLQSAIEKLSRPDNSLFSIQYLRQERAGANAARNLGIRKATGKYIQFLDSDDLLHPRKIEIQREILLSNPDLHMCYCLNEHFRETPGDMKLLWNLSAEPSHLDRLLWFDHVWQTGSPLWRKSTFETIEWWNESLICLQEWEFHLKAIAKKIRYAHVPCILQYLREHDRPRSVSLSPFVKYQESVRTAIRSTYEYLESCGLMTTDRADALAATLLASADDLIRNGFRQEGTISLNLTSQYAKGVHIKQLAHWMQIGSQNRFSWMTIGRFVRNILTEILTEQTGLFMKSKVQVEQLMSHDSRITKTSSVNSVNETNKPIASIIVPVFERSDGLKSLLQNIFAQNANSDNYEIIIVSPFSEIEIEADQFKNIRIVQKEFRSAHQARFIGAEAAQGQILIFVDLASRVSENWVSHYINAFLRYPAIAAATGPVNLDWKQAPEEWQLRLIHDLPGFNFDNGTELCMTPDASLLNKNLAISRSVFLQMKIPESVSSGNTTLNYPEMMLLQKFHNGALLFVYLPDTALTQSVLPSDMTIEFFEDDARKCGNLREYSNNLGVKRTRLELFSKMLKKLKRYVLFSLVTNSGSKSFEDARWKIEKAANFQRLKFIMKLIFT